MWEKELESFQAELQAEVISLRDAEEEGMSTEDSFMSYMLDLLSEAGETENAVVCRDIKENSIGSRIHKINAFANSENFETLDLFISVYHPDTSIANLSKADTSSAYKQCLAFFKASRIGYHRDLEESAPAYDLAGWVSKYSKRIVRVNVFLVSNFIVKHDPPPAGKQDDGVHINYYVWDLERFYRLWTSKNRREPISIDFEAFGGAVPCLSDSANNEDYDCFLAVIPGKVLANIYEAHGARLLEQNVRTFLQFTGKVNKGIRDTIRNKPHMFLPYNNGISCTAQELVLKSENGANMIASARDFQIVNGAQTTASIYHTYRTFKADLNEISVQMKLTVIKNEEEFSKTVSDISEFANSQNRITGSDLSSNHPFHIRLEELSRNIWTPDPTTGRGTRWFFERARGQYRDAQSRELTRSRKKAFEIKNPSKQRFRKEDIAKYLHTWERLPWEVVKGSQKNYALFMRTIHKVKIEDLHQTQFEDLIAKAIIFKSAEKQYGIGKNAIGDIRFITVPYSIAVLSQISNGRLNLERIWQLQDLPPHAKVTLDKILGKVNQTIKKLADGGLVSEWAKKEDSWNTLSKINWKEEFELSATDIWTKKEFDTRYSSEKSTLDELKRKEAIREIKSLSAHTWQQIDDWGGKTGKLNPWQRNIAFNIKARVRDGKKLLDIEIEQGPILLEIVRTNYPELFEESQDVEVSQTTIKPKRISATTIRQLLKWERTNRQLHPSQFEYVSQRVDKLLRLNEYERDKIGKIIATAERAGFREEDFS